MSAFYVTAGVCLGLLSRTTHVEPGWGWMILPAAIFLGFAASMDTWRR